MKFFPLFSSLVVALPSVLAAALPAADSDNTVGRALTSSAGVDIADRSADSYEDLSARQNVAPLEEIIDSLLKECEAMSVQPSTRVDCVESHIVVMGSQLDSLRRMNWVSIHAGNKFNFTGTSGVDWYHRQFQLQEDGKQRQYDLYVFDAGTIEYWTEKDDPSFHLYMRPSPTDEEPKNSEGYTGSVMTWKSFEEECKTRGLELKDC